MKASNNPFPSILLNEQASAPTTPDSGKWRVYAKSDGLYIIDDAGTETRISSFLTNPMTTAGDIIYGGASGTPTRLAAGTEDYVLKMGATNPEWAASDIGARVYNNADQSLAPNIDGVVFNSERWDTDTCHDNSTNNTRLTCKTAGKYLISAHIEISANASGYRGVYLKLNGTTNIAVDIRKGFSEAVNIITLSTIYNLEVNDYVEVWIAQDSGSILTVKSTANRSPEFMMQKIG